MWVSSLLAKTQVQATSPCNGPREKYYTNSETGGSLLITSYNINRFDFNYLMKRMQLLQVLALLNRCGELVQI